MGIGFRAEKMKFCALDTVVCGVSNIESVPKIIYISEAIEGGRSSGLKRTRDCRFGKGILSTEERSVSMAIRWDEFPHNEIRLRIYARLGQNAVGRSAEDSLRHILRRRLSSLDPEDHRRF